MPSAGNEYDVALCPSYFQKILREISVWKRESDFLYYLGYFSEYPKFRELTHRNKQFLKKKCKNSRRQRSPAISYHWIF
jgi:hypothetical protein